MLDEFQMQVKQGIVELIGNQNRLNGQKGIEPGKNNDKENFQNICVNSAEINERRVTCIRHFI